MEHGVGLDLKYDSIHYIILMMMKIMMMFATLTQRNPYNAISWRVSQFEKLQNVKGSWGFSLLSPSY